MNKSINNFDNVKNQVEKLNINEESQTLHSAKLRNIFNTNNLNIPSLGLSKKNINSNLLIAKQNNMNQCIFSNKEIKKHINDEDKNLTLNNNKNLINKITVPIDNKINIYRNRLLINNTIINKDRISFSENKKKSELKEESTNTYNNYLYLQDINESDTLNYRNPIINSKGRFKRGINYNTESKKILKTNNYYNNFSIANEKEKEKEKEKKHFNNKNKNYFSQRNMLITNIDKSPSHNISPKSAVRDILIDNSNIISVEETNKNRLKYYIDMYNYHLIQSIIQNKSNYFNMKNTNIFPFQLFKFNNNNNLNNFYNNINVNSFSIRELYRYMNRDNFLSHSNFKKNKKTQKKKKKKSFELKTAKNNNKINIKKKFNLTNLQYDLDIEKNKNKLDDLLPRKKLLNLNIIKKTKNLKNDELLYFKRNKIVGNYFQNLLRKNKNKNCIKDDILEIGLINSSPKLKIGKKKGINDLNENKDRNKKTELTKI